MRWNSAGDAVIVTGAVTGDAPQTTDMRAVKKKHPPVFLGSGVTTANLNSFSAAADGFIVGSEFKQRRSLGRCGGCEAGGKVHGRALYKLAPSNFVSRDQPSHAGLCQRVTKKFRRARAATAFALQARHAQRAFAPRDDDAVLVGTQKFHQPHRFETTSACQSFRSKGWGWVTKM